MSLPCTSLFTAPFHCIANKQKASEERRAIEMIGSGWHFLAYFWATIQCMHAILRGMEGSIWYSRVSRTKAAVTSNRCVITYATARVALVARFSPMRRITARSDCPSLRDGTAPSKQSEGSRAPFPQCFSSHLSLSRCTHRAFGRISVRYIDKPC